jgi:hypothetical protein
VSVESERLSADLPASLLQTVTKLLVDFKFGTGYKGTMNNGDRQMTPTDALYEQIHDALFMSDLTDEEVIDVLRRVIQDVEEHKAEQDEG